MTPELRNRIEAVNCDIASALPPTVADVKALISALEAAAPVADAVAECEANGAKVEFGWGADGLRLTVGCVKVFAPTLPAAVAKLAKGRGE